MKPQIVGYHNQDLEKSSARILKGGSWKKQRVVMLIPSADLIPAKVAINHASIIGPPNQGLYRMLCLGQEVGQAYTNAIEAILADPNLSTWEYLFTVEHDNICPSDILIKLIAQMEAHPEFACIAGLYWMKGEGGYPMIYGDISDPVINFRPQPPRAGELQEAYGLGMGCNLFRLSMFKDERLRKPWFKTVASVEEGVGTQDLRFFADARKYGYRFACDNSILVGHYDYSGAFGIPDFTW